MDLRARAEALIHDLENKGYEVVADLTAVAEEALEAAVSVVEQGQEAAEDFLVDLDEKFPFLDTLKGLLGEQGGSPFDSVVDEPNDEDLKEKARKAYYFLRAKGTSGYPQDVDEWYYYDTGGTLADKTFWEGLVREAERIEWDGVTDLSEPGGTEVKTNITYSLYDDYGYYRTGS